MSVPSLSFCSSYNFLYAIHALRTVCSYCSLWLKKSMGIGSLSSGSEKKQSSEKNEMHVIKTIKLTDTKLLFIRIQVSK